MATTTVKVAVRVRPMTVKETLEGATECILHLPKSPQVVIGIPDNSQTQKSFTFDNVFSPNAEQDEIYASCVEPLIEKFLLGFNATILAYGQTGSGKTYSMGTGFEENISPEQRGLLQFMGIIYLSGIIPRAIVQIFFILAQESAKDPEFESYISVSFLELYNEELVDLLAPKGKNVNGPCIRENALGKIAWSGITEEIVNSCDELFEVLKRGSLCRTTGATDMNATSSRSHAIFTVNLTQTKNLKVSNQISKQKLISKLHFVDLAGSERLKKTNSEGDRKKEGISINQELLALGNVISALGDDARKSGHVPYRDSKLTRMLQDSLGGNSQTLMLACVSPSDSNYSESLNTLVYANRAKNIRNTAIVNTATQMALNSDLHSKIQILNEENAKMKLEIQKQESINDQLSRQVLEQQHQLTKLNNVSPMKVFNNSRRDSYEIDIPNIQKIIYDNIIVDHEMSLDFNDVFGKPSNIELTSLTENIVDNMKQLYDNETQTICKYESTSTEMEKSYYKECGNQTLACGTETKSTNTIENNVETAHKQTEARNFDNNDNSYMKQVQTERYAPFLSDHMEYMFNISSCESLEDCNNSVKPKAALQEIVQLYEMESYKNEIEKLKLENEGLRLEIASNGRSSIYPLRKCKTEIEKDEKPERERVSCKYCEKTYVDLVRRDRHIREKHKDLMNDQENKTDMNLEPSQIESVIPKKRKLKGKKGSEITSESVLQYTSVVDRLNIRG